jgi:hypothetical protein
MNNILNAKLKLDQENKINKMACQQNISALESALAISYAKNALSGKAYYSSMELLISLGIIHNMPKCPSGGMYKTDGQGNVECSIHGSIK